MKAGDKQNPYFSTLRMEAKCSSEVSVKFQRTKRRYNHRCENLSVIHILRMITAFFFIML
jgi:hypothetical protein